MRTVFSDRIERYLLIALLASFALVQPLLDLLGKQAEFLVAHALEGGSLLLMAAVLSMGVPLLMAALLAGLTALLPGYRRGLFNCFFVFLTALTLLPFLSSSLWPGFLLVIIALVIGTLVLFLYYRSAAVRLFFKVLIPAVLIFPLFFLFGSRASPLLFTGDEPAVVRSATIETSPDIVFLVLDEFPLVSLLDGTLNIDAKRYPNFARLAAISNWYPGATTGAEVTTYAVPEALTGRGADPGSQQLPINANYPDNLFSLLAGRYEMNVMETATHLCPRVVCSRTESPDAAVYSAGNLVNDLLVVYAHLVSPRDWAANLPSISDGWSGFSSGKPRTNSMDPGLEDALVKADLSRQIDWRSRSVQFRNFVDSIEPGSRARLFYLHMLLPHRIWQYLPDGRQYLVSEVWEALDPPNNRAADVGHGRFGHAWQNDDWAVEVARQRHILQVQFVDNLLGELLDRLEARDMLRNSMLVVMGDHGAGFVPGQPRRTITEANFSDIAAVPLFIKQAGQVSGNIVNGPARLTDILPSVLQALNARFHGQISGVSLLENGPPPRTDIQVKHADGGQLSLPFKEHMAQLSARAQHFTHGVSPAAHSPEFANLDISALLGKAPGDFPAVPANESHQATIDAANLFETVLPQSEFVPAHIRGTLLGRGSQTEAVRHTPVLLAVSINGQIESITRSYLIPGFTDRFEALLPPASLRAGKNSVEIFRISADLSGLALQSLNPQESQTWELQLSEGEEQLVFGKQVFTLQSASGAGNVLSSPTESGSLFYLIGNTAQALDEQPIIIAFLDGEYAGQARTEDRVFSIAVAPGSASAAHKTRVRVFAVHKNFREAVELDYPAPCDPAWVFSAPDSWGGAVCQQSPLALLEKDGTGYGAILNFGDPAIRPYLLDGWALDQGSISWTLGQSASLEIPLPADIQALLFKASVKPFLSPPGFKRQMLWLLANGKPVQSWSLEALEFETIEWTIPSELLSLDPQKLKLTFLLPDAASPAAIGAGEDIRILGMAVERMEIRAR